MLSDVNLTPVLLFRERGHQDVEFDVEKGKWNVQGSKKEAKGDLFDFIQWLSVFRDDTKDLPN